jgi:uncharacterized protein
VKGAPTPIERLHRAIDAATAPLEARHAERLQCREGCSACCVDDLEIFEVEAERIRRHCGEVLDSEPHPIGGCAFLDGVGACRVYAHRPYVCRTQGLPLRWHEERAGEIVELRDICPLNEPGEPIAELEPAAFWTLGAAEEQLARLEREGGSVKRVRLRDLFRR